MIVGGAWSNHEASKRRKLVVTSSKDRTILYSVHELVLRIYNLAQRSAMGSGPTSGSTYTAPTSYFPSPRTKLAVFLTLEINHHR